jgi:mannosyl-oligosaccharide alpha-1,2-mannosidase
MLAMGSKTFNVPEDLEIAKGLMETCVYMYRTTTTGLGGDVWQITDTQPYNAITYSKSRQDLSGLRDWWYNESAESSSATSDNEAVRKATTDYSVDYKLESVKKRPATLTYVDKQYNLRPETIESLFIMYRITGDRKYQVYITTK